MRWPLYRSPGSGAADPEHSGSVLDYALLDLRQDQLAFRQVETERFHLQSLALDALHFLHLLVAGVVPDDQL
jgi:hypothetical protein